MIEGYCAGYLSHRQTGAMLRLECPFKPGEPEKARPKCNEKGSVTSSHTLLPGIVPPTLALQLWAGYPLLNLNGMLSSNFVVQYSTDLAGSNWMNLVSLSNLPASPYLSLDPAGDG